MRTRRARWLAAGPALLLIASMSGVVSAAPLEGDALAPVWVDVNGNGIADPCEAAPATADDAAVLAANLAADLNGDGTISVSEAARTDWIGGANCNHGGYVSTVAKGSAESCDDADAPDESTDESDEGPNHAALETSTDSALVETETCTEDEPEADTEEETEDAAPVVCEAAPVADGTTVDAEPLTHVQVAQSDAVGGKNCNHGGAVSASAKAAKAEREAARALKTHGKAHGKHGKHGKHGGQ
ncbi:MAG TPA: hypothetical protein VF119_06520 [Candidatus Limnocylindrales bacterium]